MPVFTFRTTDVTLNYGALRVRVWTADPDELGDIRCVLAHATDTELEGAVVGAFIVDASLAYTLPASLATYAQRTIDAQARRTPTALRPAHGLVDEPDAL